MEDYYKVLGLKRGSSLKEISAAYRSLALIYHPDKRKISVNGPAGENDEKFHKIKTAYQSLQDPKIRAELDLQLIGQEERIKRESKMSAERKKMRDDLLSREKEAASFVIKKREFPTKTTELKKTSENSVFNNLIVDENSTLLLKCKFPDDLDKNLSLEMIRASLNPLSIYEHLSTVAVEFRSPQEAYGAFCRLPKDFIIKADWFKGYPPDGIIIGLGQKQTLASTNPPKNQPEEKVKYSKELEESVLEKLKRKKLEKQEQQTTPH